MLNVCRNSDRFLQTSISEEYHVGNPRIYVKFVQIPANSQKRDVIGVFLENLASFPLHPQILIFWLNQRMERATYCRRCAKVYYNNLEMFVDHHSVEIENAENC